MIAKLNFSSQTSLQCHMIWCSWNISYQCWKNLWCLICLWNCVWVCLFVCLFVCLSVCLFVCFQDSLTYVMFKRTVFNWNRNQRNSLLSLLINVFLINKTINFLYEKKTDPKLLYCSVYKKINGQNDKMIDRMIDKQQNYTLTWQMDRMTEYD